jgi:hypothetical protein
VFLSAEACWLDKILEKARILLRKRIGTAMGEIIVWLTHEIFDKAVEHMVKRRAEAARGILQDQLSRAEINIADATDRDEAAAMIFSYTEAAKQGSARRNLRMLAQILAGALATPPIYADEFLRWTRILADLSREEIIILAKFHANHNNPILRDDKGMDYNATRDRLQTELMAQGIITDRMELDSILGALLRTGLVLYSAGGFGGAWHLPTPKLDKLVKLANFDAALSEPDR